MNSPDKTHILVVDDNPQNLTAISSVLKESEYMTVFARSAREALRYMLRYNFAVILLDVQMPDMDGFETARLIRSREKSRHTPILFLSAWYKDEIEVNKGYRLGDVDYILKPIHPDILKHKISLFTQSSLAVNLQNESKKRLHAEQQTKMLESQQERPRFY